MKILIGLLLTLVASGSTMAGPTLITNPYLPYPPACAWIPDPYGPVELDSQAVKFHDREIQLHDSSTGVNVPMTLRAFRMPCSEPNRSLIWLEFTLAASRAHRGLKVELPTVAAEVAPNRRKLMSLAIEPNGWGSAGWVDRERVFLISHVEGVQGYYNTPEGNRRWVFLLDNKPPFPDAFYGEALTPTEYNAAFKLVLRSNPYDILTIDVPATAEVLTADAPRMPLSGRLSGNWVIPGTADQGLLLSISEMVLPDVPLTNNDADMPMVIFLAHYTYDEAGDMLWLTGAAEFGPGQRKITIPIELVTNGEFRGSRRASREVIGSVTLRSRSCNDLTFEYDYSGAGLGTGRRRLERLLSMETAGHACRDFEARIEANR